MLINKKKIMILTLSTIISLSGFGLLTAGLVGELVNEQLKISTPAYSTFYVDPAIYESLEIVGGTLITIGCLGLLSVSLQNGFGADVSAASALNTSQSPVVSNTQILNLPAQTSTNSLDSLSSSDSGWLTPPIDSSSVQIVETTMAAVPEHLMITSKAVTSWMSIFDTIFSFFSS